MPSCGRELRSDTRRTLCWSCERDRLAARPIKPGTRRVHVRAFTSTSEAHHLAVTLPAEPWEVRT